MNVLDLFSGVGGFSLGLKRAGMRTVAFCEIDPFCRRVIAKHWPGVLVYDDVRTLTSDRLRADGISIDLICGGFPCQDLSLAQGSSRAGLGGERSGLWSEYARLIGELRPRFVIVENVTGLLSLGVGDVFRDLAAIRYDAEWQVIPAGAVGAPHIRDRFWLVGYPNGDKQPALAINDETSRMSRMAADANGINRRPGGREIFSHIADGLEVIDGRWWASEPGISRVDDGLPNAVDRNRSLGNAVVPQIPELIGRAIMRASAVTQKATSHD